MEKYKLREYIEQLQENNQIEEIIDCDEILDKQVNFLTYNSRDVEDNTLFVCKGFGDNFKEEYLKDAINYGAFVYVSEKKYDINMPCIIVKNAFVSLSILSSKYYSKPQEKLNVIGITGTKGKSTTTYYIKYILDEYARALNNKDTAVISSIDTYDGVENFESHLTTPESLDMYRHLYNAVNSDIKSIVMEVSSQALKIGRVYSLDLDIAVFMNISEDHISSIEHPDFEDYFKSKLKIFDRTKIACINLDTDRVDEVLENARKSESVVTFSTKNTNANVYGYDIRKDGYDTVFKVKTKMFDREFRLTMPGLFNVENALAAISAAISLNIPEQYIYEGLVKARSSGRMEIYRSKDEKIIAIVDYAHNKLSFEKLFESTKSEYNDRKITIIFGCPGKKAYIRRRDLGTVAGKYADKIFLVAEDPGYEPVEDISRDIAKYVSEYNQNYEMIEDRGEAIKKAIDEARENNNKTVILITGKGNETRQKYGSEYLPCKSDVEYTKLYLDEYDKEMQK